MPYMSYLSLIILLNYFMVIYFSSYSSCFFTQLSREKKNTFHILGAQYDNTALYGFIYSSTTLPSCNAPFSGYLKEWCGDNDDFFSVYDLSKLPYMGYPMILKF